MIDSMHKWHHYKDEKRIKDKKEKWWQQIFVNDVNRNASSDMWGSDGTDIVMISYQQILRR